MTLTYGPGLGAQAKRNQFQRDAIMSATPARLLTMLYDRLLLDLNRAEAAQQAQQWSVASENLIHAQAIVSELMSTLKADVWDGGDGLKALYTYTLNAMMNANIHRDAARTRECIELLEPLREAWHQTAGQLPAKPARGAGMGGELGIA